MFGSNVVGILDCEKKHETFCHSGSHELDICSTQSSFSTIMLRIYIISLCDLNVFSHTVGGTIDNMG